MQKSIQFDKISTLERIVSAICRVSIGAAMILNIIRAIFVFIAIIIAPAVAKSQDHGDISMSEEEFVSTIRYLSSPVVIRDTVEKVSTYSNNIVFVSFNRNLDAQYEADLSLTKTIVTLFCLSAIALTALILHIALKVWRSLHNHSASPKNQ